MNDLQRQIKIHFICESTNKLIAQPVVFHAPNSGDEIRLSDTRYYKVNRLVWCYDEPTAFYSRLNVGVTLIDGEV